MRTQPKSSRFSRSGSSAEAVVAQMRVAVDHPDMGHRRPPGLEQQGCDLVAGFEQRVLEGQEPCPSSQPMLISRRVDSSGCGSGVRDVVAAGEEAAIEPDVPGLALIVELFPQPRGDLLDGLGRIDGAFRSGE